MQQRSRFLRTSLVILSLMASTCGGAGGGGRVFAADLDTAELLFRSGDLDDATRIAQEEVDNGIWNERWSRLLIRCQLAQGQYQDAVATYEAAIKRYSSSLVLRRLGIEAYRYTGRQDQAKQANAQFLDVLRRSSRYASRDNVLAAGRYFADRGEDARQILQQFYDRVKEADPDHLETYIATAELAISKGDFKVAGDTLRQAVAIDPTDPRVFYLQARAFAPSDSRVATEAINMALTLNPNHVDSLLLQAENAIDGEQMEIAEELISRVLEVNLYEPRAWALHAVIAHVAGRFDVENLMRSFALSSWPQNPEVDHLIGRKLSDKYRFAEGSEYQRKALAFDPQYTPAQFQLAQDLLRLGFDDVGWALAEQVNEKDPYNVTAFNLVSLYDSIKGFETLSVGDINVRMESKEASIYGDEVLELLSQARQVLCEKYSIEPDGPIIVEIFPEQSDFAIRTFGLPGGAGFLGVCFGRVITANSPASQGANPSNWQSVLWHEFCHVVTLSKTKNRMPRWLSEGISVYEERQRDASWSEKMTPTYKLMILGDDLSPISRLSAAFLKPKSPVHLQFAYYESSLAVEYLIDRHGLDKLKLILDDLAEGVAINDALINHVGSIQRLDEGFIKYAREKAEQFGDGVDWNAEGPDADASPADTAAWLAAHPRDYRTLRSAAERLASEEKYDEAIEAFEELRAAGVVGGGRGGVLDNLATLYAKVGNETKEREMLEMQIGMAPDLWRAHQRLAEFAESEQDWDAVDRHADAILAINPLMRIGHELKGAAAERRQRPEDVIAPLQALLELDPIDPAGLHYRLAVAWENLEKRDEAKRAVLKALVDAPRYQDALELLLRVSGEKS